MVKNAMIENEWSKIQATGVVRVERDQHGVQHCICQAAREVYSAITYSGETLRKSRRKLKTALIVTVPSAILALKIYDIAETEVTLLARPTLSVSESGRNDLSVEILGGVAASVALIATNVVEEDFKRYWSAPPSRLTLICMEAAVHVCAVSYFILEAKEWGLLSAGNKGMWIYIAVATNSVSRTAASWFGLKVFRGMEILMGCVLVVALIAITVFVNATPRYVQEIVLLDIDVGSLCLILGEVNSVAKMRITRLRQLEQMLGNGGSEALHPEGVV